MSEMSEMEMLLAAREAVSKMTKRERKLGGVKWTREQWAREEQEADLEEKRAFAAAMVKVADEALEKMRTVADDELERIMSDMNVHIGKELHRFEREVCSYRGDPMDID